MNTDAIQLLMKSIDEAIALAEKHMTGLDQTRADHPGHDDYFKRRQEAYLQAIKDLRKHKGSLLKDYWDSLRAELGERDGKNGQPS